MGNKALSAYRLTPQGKRRVQLTYKLKPGDMIEIKANPNDAVMPSAFDHVATRRARESIRRNLNKRHGEKKVQSATRYRAIRIIEWLYSTKRKKRIDLHRIYGFDPAYCHDNELSVRYQNIEFFLQKLGMVAVQSQSQRAYKDWLDKKQRNQTISDAFRLVDNLITYRASRPTLLISIGDQIGVLKALGEILERHNLSVIPIRGKADQYASGGKPALLECVLAEGDVELIRAVVAELGEKFPAIDAMIRPGKPIVS